MSNASTNGYFIQSVLDIEHSIVVKKLITNFPSKSGSQTIDILKELYTYTKANIQLSGSADTSECPSSLRMRYA